MLCQEIPQGVSGCCIIPVQHTKKIGALLAHPGVINTLRPVSNRIDFDMRWPRIIIASFPDNLSSLKFWILDQREAVCSSGGSHVRYGCKLQGRIHGLSNRGSQSLVVACGRVVTLAGRSHSGDLDGCNLIRPSLQTKKSGVQMWNGHGDKV